MYVWRAYQNLTPAPSTKEKGLKANKTEKEISSSSIDLKLHVIDMSFRQNRTRLHLLHSMVFCGQKMKDAFSNERLAIRYGPSRCSYPDD